MTRLDADSILDACVEQAARIAEAPMSLITLVMRHVQLFRAHRGLPEELALSCATSRSASFCQIVVKEERPLVVEDAPRDPRVPQEMVEQFGIQAYAGVPLLVDGQPVGALCVMDTVPRIFGPEVIAALDSLGAQVAARLAELVAADEVIPDGPPTPPAERLRNLRRKAALLDAALSAVGPALEQARGAEVVVAPSLDPEVRADLAEGVAFHGDLAAATLELLTEAARLARASNEPRWRALLVEASTVEREIVEVTPLARLAEGALFDRVSQEGAAKAALVTREALDFHGGALAAVRRLLAAAAELEAEWGDAAPGHGEGAAS